MSKKNTTFKICITALFLGLNIVFSSFSLPVPGGHLYLNDVVICLASLLLEPWYAFCVGGIGAFLGDFFFYPTPMFVSLVVHGLQAIIISVFAHYIMKKHTVASSLIGLILGAMIMIVGYSLGRAFVYATVETAILKLPFQVLQAMTGVVVAPILSFKCGVKNAYETILNKRK